MFSIKILVDAMTPLAQGEYSVEDFKKNMKAYIDAFMEALKKLGEATANQ